MFRKNDQLDFFSTMMYDTMIPKNHKLRKLNAACDWSFVDGLVADTYKSSRRGAPGYDPSVIFRILVLRRLYNLSLDKVLERCQCDVAFRWFAGLNVHDELPCKATLSTFFRFRLGNGGLRKFFNETIRQGKALGLVSGKRLLVDGTIVRGNFRVRGQGQIIMALAIQLLKNTDLWGEVPLPKNDSLEDRLQFGKDVLKLLSTIELTPRLSKKKDLLERVIDQQGSKDKIEHFRDEDARATKRKDQRKVGYTTLIGMDPESGLTTAVTTFSGGNDEGEHFLPLVSEHINQVGEKPDQVLADTAFGAGSNLRALFEQGIKPLIPPRTKQTPGTYHRDLFTYSEEEQSLKCPAGHITKNHRPFRGGLQFRFSKRLCKSCPLKNQCTTSEHRRVEISHYNNEITKVNELLDSNHDGHRKVRMRIEQKFAESKCVHGLHTADGFSLESTERQSLMTFSVTNLMRIATLLFGNRRASLPLPQTT